MRCERQLDQLSSSLESSWFSNEGTSEGSERSVEESSNVAKRERKSDEPRNLSKPRTKMQSNLPTLRENPLPIVVVGFEDPAEPGVPTSDVVELTGLRRVERKRRVSWGFGAALEREWRAIEIEKDRCDAHLISRTEDSTVLPEFERRVSVEEGVSFENEDSGGESQRGSSNELLRERPKGFKRVTSL